MIKGCSQALQDKKKEKIGPVRRGQLLGNRSLAAGMLEMEKESKYLASMGEVGTVRHSPDRYGCSGLLWQATSTPVRQLH